MSSKAKRCWNCRRCFKENRDLDSGTCEHPDRRLAGGKKPTVNSEESCEKWEKEPTP